MVSHKSSERIKSIIEGLSRFGEDLRSFVDPNISKDAKNQNLQQAIEKSRTHNAWFTHENTLTALQAWGNLLQHDHLQSWLSEYQLDKNFDAAVGIVMAGNLPLVGFHDLLCVLISGHRASIKMSSKDRFLIPELLNMMTNHLPEWNNKVTVCDDQLKGYDKVIATGSNNSSRYFEYYFRKVPHVLRKNRSSLAVLSGNESEEELKGLVKDVSLYFGLGCRSVSKILVPKDYDFDILFNALYDIKDLIHHHSYANNYDYNRAVFLMSEDNILDNGFMLVKQDDRLSSPIGCLYFDYYENFEQVKSYVNQRSDEIQCIVSHMDGLDSVPFGSAQFPKLDDYADGVDTLSFLLKK